MSHFLILMVLFVSKASIAYSAEQSDAVSPIPVTHTPRPAIDNRPAAYTHEIKQYACIATKSTRYYRYSNKNGEEQRLDGWTHTKRKQGGLYPKNDIVSAIKSFQKSCCLAYPKAKFGFVSTQRDSILLTPKFNLASYKRDMDGQYITCYTKIKSH